MHSGQIKIFNQPGFPWNFCRVFSFQKATEIRGNSVVWGRNSIWPDAWHQWLGGGGCKKCRPKNGTWSAHFYHLGPPLDHPFLASQKTHLYIYHLSLKFSLSKSQDPFFLHTTPFTTTINHLKIGLKKPQKGHKRIHKRIIWTVHPLGSFRWLGFSKNSTNRQVARGRGL